MTAAYIDLGSLLLRLEHAKTERGVNWSLWTSFCSDQPVFIARVMLQGRTPQSGLVRVGPLAEVLEWAAWEAER